MEMLTANDLVAYRSGSGFVEITVSSNVGWFDIIEFSVLEKQSNFSMND